MLSLCSALTSEVAGNQQHLNHIMTIAKQCLKDSSSTLRSMALLAMSDVIKSGRGSVLFEDSLGMQVRSLYAIVTFQDMLGGA